MVNAHIDTTHGLDGEPIVLAVFDLAEPQLAAAAHAVAATSVERYRNASLSADDVVEMRELTALRDELDDLGRHPGHCTVVLRPARLTALRNALQTFVETRDEADWIRPEDGEPLAHARALLWPLDDLAADATRAALSPPPAPHAC